MNTVLEKKKKISLKIILKIILWVCVFFLNELLSYQNLCQAITYYSVQVFPFSGMDGMAQVGRPSWRSILELSCFSFRKRMEYYL